MPVRAQPQKNFLKAGLPPPRTASRTIRATPVAAAVKTDGSLIANVPKPGIADVLKALKLLRHKFSVIAKNEQLLSTKLDRLDLRLQALDINLLNAINWIILWIIYTPYNELDVECLGVLISAPREPYWV